MIPTRKRVPVAVEIALPERTAWSNQTQLRLQSEAPYRSGDFTGTKIHIYEVRPRKDHRGVDLISDVLPFGRLWYDTPDHAIGYAMHSSRSHDAMIHVYDAA